MIITVQDFLRETIFHRIHDKEKQFPFSVNLEDKKDSMAIELYNSMPIEEFDINLVKNLKIGELTDMQKFEISRIIFASMDLKFANEIVKHFNTYLNPILN